MITITIACPESMIPQANQLARCIGEGPDDDKTFALALWQDAAGNRYAVASGPVSETFPETAASPLVAPSWGCDLALASVAQAAIRIGAAAAPSHIAAVIGDDPQAAIAAMGLEPVPSDPLA